MHDTRRAKEQAGNGCGRTKTAVLLLASRGSKRETIVIDSRFKMSNFRAERNIFTAWFWICS